MFVRIRDRFLNYSVAVVKNGSRKYTVPTVVESKKTDEVVYPPIVEISRLANKKREKEKWHVQVQKVQSVEEKQYKINMPYYYGCKGLYLDENRVPYNSLEHAQYITRTHVAEDHRLPDIYNNVIASEELDSLTDAIKGQIEDCVAFEHSNRLRQHELTDIAKTEPSTVENALANGIIYQINRTMLANLSAKFPHLLETQVDFEPRIEAGWFVGGIEPTLYIRKSKEGSEYFKQFVDELIEMPVHYIGKPVINLRHDLPLKEIVPLSQSEDTALNVPTFTYDPRVLGYNLQRRHLTNIPGFWPGDPSEFGTLSFHNRGHLLNRPPKCDDTFDALVVQAIFSSYSWLLGQACYQGFTTFNDVTYPLTSQVVITNGQWWSFCAYQLNTLLLHSEYVSENPRRNLCWITEPMKLFDTVENEKVHGFNVDVLKLLLKFYSNVPEERTAVNMKPYVGKSEKVIADIEDDARRVWVDKHYKHLVSNRPRHWPHEEIYNWQKIYLIDHKTRPMDKKRHDWERGINPMKRRLDEHLPVYVPRCLRANPKKRKHDRWAKTYYP